MGTRRTARENALQMLYQWDLNAEDISVVAAAFWEVHPAGADVRTFAEELVRFAAGERERIDDLISRHARGWRLERMETVDRNVLRLATSELLIGGATPASVIINEAIEIARRFSTAGSAQFVNGLLDSIRKEIESQSGSPSNTVTGDR